MDRKTFVKTLSTAALAASCPTFLAGCAGLPYVSGEFSDAGMQIPLDALEGKEFALVDIPGYRAPVFVARDVEGAFSAVSLRCTHKNCVLKPQDGELACPCHGSRFTFLGELLEGPAETDLDEYEATVAEGLLTIGVRRL